MVSINTSTAGEAPTDSYSSGTCPEIIQYILFTYNPGTVQTAASVLGLKMSDILHWSFKSGVSVSCSPPAFSEVSKPQSQLLSGLIFPVQISRVESAWCGLHPLAPWRGPVLLGYPSSLWIAAPGVWFWSVSLPSCILCGPSLYVFSCRAYILPVLGPVQSELHHALLLPRRVHGWGELRILLRCHLSLLFFYQLFLLLKVLVPIKIV